MPTSPKARHATFDRKPASKAALTHEQLTADLERFRADGGHIEKLGNTNSLLKVGMAATQATPASPTRQGGSRQP
ncbi:hypothetical protein LF41_302 [Lysobacter dokdonensis DS-58]|uniref:Uncharacterized protein n=1 Tax=Lysobacter dokdonensis DS-58 TaxID=1300345 RepID=A0A0A2X0M3_9GAMM|nr:hypothetical protein [Lysobacter dokdonensis]KGQ18769.1 hypothetical protein LF41_302 [Lysobacter dokdonensis DS-58]